jgi:hypothetical protein
MSQTGRSRYIGVLNFISRGNFDDSIFGLGEHDKPGLYCYSKMFDFRIILYVANHKIQVLHQHRLQCRLSDLHSLNPTGFGLHAKVHAIVTLLVHERPRSEHLIRERVHPRRASTLRVPLPELRASSDCLSTGTSNLLFLSRPTVSP